MVDLRYPKWAVVLTAGVTFLTSVLPRSARAQWYVFYASSFATTVVSSQLSGTDPNFDPNGLLGQPCLTFNASTNPNVVQSQLASIVSPPFNYNLNGGPVLAELPNYPSTTEVTVQMGAPITHDPNHPYGDDLIVFGNSFFLGAGTADDSTNLNSYIVNGSVYSHPVQVSVSPDNKHWFSFPVTAGLQPYNAYQWDDTDAEWTTNELNPTIPLNPSVYTTSFANQSAASVLDAYGNSAGGTAFDLENALDSNGNTLFQDGFNSIDYVQVSSVDSSNPDGGYSVISGISAVSDAEPTAISTFIPEPTNMTAIAVGGLSLLRRPRA